MEGGKTVLFKEAAVKFLDPTGQQLGSEVITSSGSSLIPAGQYGGSRSGAGGTGGSSTAVSEAGTGDGSAAGSKLDPAR